MLHGMLAIFMFLSKCIFYPEAIMSSKLKEVFFRSLLIGFFVLISTWTFEYFFFGKKTAQDSEFRAGQSFVASSKPLDIRPLNTEVDFVDRDIERPIPVEHEIIDTDTARLTFSNQGATLERLEFKRTTTGRATILTTVYPVSEVDRENRCFLVAFEEKTPFNYQKIAHTDERDHVELVYQASSKYHIVTKTFIVHKNSYQIDLKLEVAPQHGQTDVHYRPRIFFPAPILPDIRTDDVVAEIVLNERGTLEITPSTKIDTQRGWFAPSLFGLQDKYFIHALVKDTGAFTHRAYYYQNTQAVLYAILEGSLQTERMQWALSFYCGPKESSAVSAVDPRLEQALEHAGFFAPISRGLLALLVFLFSYVGNYGVAIVLLTIMIRLLLWPFAIKSTRTMKNGKADDIQKKLKYIELKYKDDPERLAQERSALMRAQGSMMVSGCLPLLLQIPVMYALNRALANSVLLYGASFLWIPDLSARDPYMILSMLIVVAMLLQSLYVDKQQRPMLMIMSIVIGALSVSWSAGLALYWALSTLIGVLQSFLQQRMKLV